VTFEELQASAQSELRVGHAKTPSGEGRAIPVNNPDLFSIASERIQKLEKESGLFNQTAIYFSLEAS
jgi:hypothetical protein